MPVFDDLGSWIHVFLATNQYLALFVFLFIEEAGIPLPIPGDMIIAALGYRVTNGEANPLLLVLIVTTAVVLGSSVLYLISRHIGRPALNKFGHYIRLNEKRLAQMESWLNKHGAVAIIFGRLVPGLRIPTSVAAAVFGIPYHTFVPSIAISASLWAIIYVSFGMLFGASQEQIQAALLNNLPLTLSILALAIVLGGVGFLIARKRR